MKRRLCLIAAFLFAAAMLVSCGGGDGGGDSAANVEPNVDENVLKCFNLTNEFRTGSEAYYWNEDNATKTSLVGKLSRLELDNDLCRAAQVRANEIVRSFSHTRPNGSGCFTVFDDLGISASAQAENIAVGNKSGEKTFLQWKEDDKNYAGQGHRRNMLGAESTRIGIAYAYDANSEYKYYWAMVLAK